MRECGNARIKNDTMLGVIWLNHYIEALKHYSIEALFKATTAQGSFRGKANHFQSLNL